ncbi:MAG: TonB-dependent receptor [Myxococcales bacterium]|nr:TonB-dependent receptor [Myxococcales bacterium]
MPRTDPDYPGVELDLFPTKLLSSITLSKSPEASLRGGFVGGLMDVQTRAYPERRLLALGVSLGGNSLTTFQSFDRVTPPTRLDGLALGARARALPSGIPTDRRLEVSSRGVSSETYNRVVDQFPDQWDDSTGTAAPAFGLELGVGDTLETSGGRSVGYLVLLGYDRSVRHEQGFARSGQLVDGQLVAAETLQRERFDTRTSLGGLGTLSLELGDGHDIRVVTLLNQTATDRFETASGLSDEQDGLLDRSTAQYLARTLSFTQVLGSHRQLLPETSAWHETRVDWSASFASAARVEPDTRDFASLDGLWDDNPGPATIFVRTSRSATTADGLRDAPRAPRGDTLELAAGGEIVESHREFDSRRFHYQVAGGENGLAAADRALGPEDLFSDERVGSVGAGAEIVLADQARGGDAYVAAQTSAAGFGSVEVRLAPPLTLHAGVRQEWYRQRIEDTSIGATDPAAERVDLDTLPSASLVAALRREVYLRAAYGASVARPQAREVAPFVYQDYVRRRTVTGNADLERTYVHNTDLRLEWYPSATEVLAITAFNKAFRYPIEATVDTAGAVSFVNADAASDFGGEAEVQLSLGRVSSALRGLALGLNVTVVASSVTLPCDDENGDGECDLQFTDTKRPLVGQAPWVVNASLTYSAPSDVWSVSAYYNVLGPALVEAGINGQPNTSEQPTHMVDLAATARLSESLRLKVGARNLAGVCTRLEQDDLVVARRCRGTDASVGLTWTPAARDDE